MKHASEILIQVSHWLSHFGKSHLVIIYLKTNLRDRNLSLNYQSKKRGILEGILELHKVIFIKMHIIQIINNTILII